MITNPKVGQRVRFIDTSVGYSHSHLIGQLATITRILAAPHRAASLMLHLEFDNYPRDGGNWWDHRVEPAELSSEEQDQKNRQAHADKYL